MKLIVICQSARDLASLRSTYFPHADLEDFLCVSSAADLLAVPPHSLVLYLLGPLELLHTLLREPYDCYPIIALEKDQL